MDERRRDDAGRGTALVADDEATLLRLLTRVLERAGYRVVGAATVEEARRAVTRERSLAAAVVDATLHPGDTGPLLQALAEAPGRPALVVTSGEALAPDAQEALAARGGRFLAKPFSPAHLVAVLEALREAAEGAPTGS